MRTLGGRMHWLTVGLALLVSAQGFTTRSNGQAPLKPSGRAAKKKAEARPVSYSMRGRSEMAAGPMGPGPGMVAPAGGMITPQAGMSYAIPGPPPGEVAYAGCDSLSGMGCSSCGGGLCGGGGCGPSIGGMLSGGSGCGWCGGGGCAACGFGSGSMFPGRLASLLGPLAPFSEGGGREQRWFDIYAGTIALTRTSDFGPFSTLQRNMQTGEFLTSDVISTDGIAGSPALRTSDVDMDQMRYGLELIANLQTGPGSNLEVRYFGLNRWEENAVARRSTPTLYSAFSLYGTSPNGGFDDTDQSFIHELSYDSELHNGEVNFRRRFNSPFTWGQGSWLMGIRYFDLDERFGFGATGGENNTFTFDQLRFFNMDVHTRNQLTGFQIGGDYWISVVPGFSLGVEGKSGIYGNHSEVSTQVVANSIVSGDEFLQDGRTAFLSEFAASAVYRLSYSWAVKASYNLLYVDNVALAAENFNTRDLSNALGNGNFTGNRFPFLNNDGEVFYQGWSIGGEFTY